MGCPDVAYGLIDFLGLDFRLLFNGDLDPMGRYLQCRNTTSQLSDA